MPVIDPAVVAGLLLVVGPVLGLIPVAHPALIPVWSAPRERHLAIVAGHRRLWWALNCGFGIATTSTLAGLAILPTLATDRGGAAAVVPGAIAYGVGCVLWCIVLAIRARVTPLLGDHLANGMPTEPAEAVVGAAQSGLFAGFVLLTALGLVALDLGLWAAGIGPSPVAAFQVLAGLGLLAWLLRAGDVIPALIYLPTLVLGLALLLR